MENLISLVYLSDVAEKVDEQEIQKILHHSKKNNSKIDITGVLVLLNNRFLQVLEGDKKMVNELYDKIKVDKRHSKVLTLINFDLEKRNFKDWSMAYFNYSKEIHLIDGSKDPEVFIEEISKKETWTPAFELLKKFYYKNR